MTPKFKYSYYEETINHEHDYDEMFESFQVSDMNDDTLLCLWRNKDRNLLGIWGNPDTQDEYIEINISEELMDVMFYKLHELRREQEDE